MSVVSQANLSGSQWWHANEAKYPNSNKVTDLAGDFRPKVEAFLKALADAGAKVSIESTRRNETRAWLMHYSWQIAHGQILPKAVPKKTGLDIVWDHGDAARSRQAALEMVRLFGMAHQAALQSNHISGRAIDMDITWHGVLKIKRADGKTFEIKSSPQSGQNHDLQQVGKSYGVIKLATDPPHWSYNGH